MAKTAKKILLNGDLTYYEKLKSQLQQQSKWDSQYLILLQECAVKLHYIKYMEILEKEQEFALLLEQLKKHMDQIYRFGGFLSEKYPTDICVIFTSQVSVEADAAHKRELYREVCSHIAMFKKTGCKAEAAELVKGLKDKYKRKPAFVDELQKI